LAIAGSDLVLVVVPEPGTAAMLGVAGAAIAVGAWRRRFRREGR
jgi:hypothetical protein